MPGHVGERHFGLAVVFDVVPQEPRILLLEFARGHRAVTLEELLRRHELAVRRFGDLETHGGLDLFALLQKPVGPRFFRMPENVETPQPAGKGDPDQEENEDRPEEEIVALLWFFVVIVVAVEIVSHGEGTGDAATLRGRSMLVSSGLGVRRFKRGAATAAPGRVRILDAEPRAGEIVHIVDRRTREKMRALGVDDHFHTAPLHHLVAVLGVIQPHRVLQPGATPVFHENAQAIRGIHLLADEDFELRKSGISDVNHAAKVRRPANRAKWQVARGNDE